MENMFSGASAFNQQLCWNVTGKTVTNMFTNSNGASIIDCTSQPTGQPTNQPTTQPTGERTTIVTNTRDILQSVVRIIKNTIKPMRNGVETEL